MKTTTKYEYWKWVLLKKHTELFEKNCVSIHDRLQNRIFIYDIYNNKKVTMNFEQNLLSMLYSVLPYFVTIGELPEFYKSLPNKYKKVFWDLVER